MHIEQKTNRIFRPTGNTTLAAEETNQITTEIENQITAGGLTPNAGTLTQLRDSIQNVVDTAANELQEQIDAITSSSDVFDVVGTYAQLQAYDTATVPVNDIIKVLQDETRQNAMTYYRWNGTTWVFIGAEGPYYTVSETDTKFALKTQLPGVATTQQAGLVKPDGQSVLVGQDGTISVAQSVAASMPLFTCQFTDHLLNDASYLRADTFSWQSGSVYISAYQHLISDIAGKTAKTETISGITITFYRATDGHKICLAAQEGNVSNLYNATGIAWYYVLDTANTRFKLPRSQYNFVGLRTSVGSYVEESLPNITGTFSVVRKGGADMPAPTGAFTVQKYNAGNGSGGVDDYGGTFTLDASRSSSTYQNGATVQQASTQMYLYFYCGNTVQSQTTIDVGQITETLNGKSDNDLQNVSGLSGFRRLIEISPISLRPTWYKVFREYDPTTGQFLGNWCEMGGYSTTDTITFPKQMADNSYTLTVSSYRNGTATSGDTRYITQFSKTGFTKALDSDESFWWRVEGYL